MFYISMFFGQKCQDFYLTQEGTWTSTLCIRQEFSGLNKDIVLPVRALEGKCYLTAPPGIVWESKGSGEERELVSGTSLRMGGPGFTINALVLEMDRESMIMRKYELPLHAPIRIGRAEDTVICQDSNILTAKHGEITATADQECVYTDYSRNGTFINGERVLNQKVKLNFGDIITMGFGLRIVYLGNQLAVNTPPYLKWNRLQQIPPRAQETYDVKEAQKEDQTSAVILYQRSPRILDNPDTDEVSIEAPLPRDNANIPPTWMTVGPSATMVVPMLLSAMVGGRSNIAPMLAMIGGASAMAVMWALINRNYRTKHGEETEQKRLQVYRDYIVETENKLLSLTEREMARLEQQNMSITQCLALPSSNIHRLWERMPQHEDFTRLRLGKGRVNLPSPISVPDIKLQLEPDPMQGEPGRLKETYQHIEGAPITVDLRDWQIVGVLGSAEHPYVLQSMLAQLAATHSYHDVQIALLSEQGVESQWDWVRWLPHAFDGDERNMRLAAFTPGAVQAVLDYLSDVLMVRDERTSETSADDPRKPMPLPHYVVFCTNPDLMEGQPFMRRMLSRPLGFTLVILASSMDRLPKECGIIIHAEQKLGAVYTASGELTNVKYEVTDLNALRRFGREIAPIRVRDTSESSFIPSLVTFFESYHARYVEDIDVWRFWNENHAYEGLRSTVGLRSGAKPFVLDISERAHGPHGLVAGTTGSGKSVMLQTYILSLALNYHPEEVQFILIDYKGGGMANVFTDLPHVAGIIDNLQGQRTISRALLSIQGEIKRREETFKRLGVEKIDEYIQYYNHDPNEQPLAHLIIVVDEFAELKKEQPEFMHELVSTARVGRSVGIHMILATQKPSNSVDDEIWSNTNFRICLRVATRGDSNDMLKRPDAAYLKGMGRCYVQVGNDEIFEQVQTCFSGAEYDPYSLVGDEQPRMLDEAGRPITLKRKNKNANAAVKPKTQMEVVLEKINSVMAEHSVNRARPLWLRELESVVLLDHLPGFEEISFDGKAWKSWNDLSDQFRVYYGMVDDVRMQRHLPLYVDFMQDHNMKILAPAGAGKTTLIQTMVLSAALTYTPEQVNMYIFSLTSRTLGILSRLPHVGEVVFEDETAEIIQLLNLLVEENKRRSRLFAEQMTDSFAQYNITAAGSGGKIKRLPAILVFVDRLKHLMEKLDENRLKQFYDLVRNAASRGIYFVVTAIAISSEELGRISDFFTGLAIQQEDRAVYKEILGATGVITPEEAAVRAVPGRGLVWFDNGMHGPGACEMQCAIYGSQVDSERVAIVERLASSMAEQWTGPVPQGIVRIPENLTVSVYTEMLSRFGVSVRPGVLPVGLNKENGTPVLIDLDRTPSFLICGGNQSGKTTCILAIAEMLRQARSEVHLFGENQSLSRYAAAHAEMITFHGLSDSESLKAFFLQQLNPVMIERKQKLAEAGEDDEAARSAVTESFRPLALLFDDYDQFARVMYEFNDILTWMQKINRIMAGRRLYFILSMSHRAFNRSTTNEFVQDVARSGTGIALGGGLSEADPWSVATGATRRVKLPIGEAFYVQGGTVSQMVIPQLG